VIFHSCEKLQAYSLLVMKDFIAEIFTSHSEEISLVWEKYENLKFGKIKFEGE